MHNEMRNEHVMFIKFLWKCHFINNFFFFARAPNEVIILWQNVIVHVPREIITSFRIFSPLWTAKPCYVQLARLKNSPCFVHTRGQVNEVSLGLHICLEVRRDFPLSRSYTEGLIKTTLVGHFLLMSWNFQSYMFIYSCVLHLFYLF